MKEFLLVTALWATFGGGLLLGDALAVGQTANAPAPEPDKNDPMYKTCAAQQATAQMDRHSMQRFDTTEQINEYMAKCMGKGNG